MEYLSKDPLPHSMMDGVGADHGKAAGCLWHRPDTSAPGNPHMASMEDMAGPTADMFFHSAAAMDTNANHVNPASYYASPAAARAVHSYRPTHGELSHPQTLTQPQQPLCIYTPDRVTWLSLYALSISYHKV